MNNDSFIIGLSRRPFVWGWELRRAIDALTESLRPMLPRPLDLRVTWEPISTAAVNRHGQMKLAVIREDAQVSRAQFIRYVGFVIHEMLHLAYTNFDARGQGAYLDRLHNAVEDVWIERRGIANLSTGNIRSVLTDLLHQIVGESLDQVKDWTDPAQYPFAFAVYGRGYGVNVPVADGLEPIFAEASRRIDTARSSHDTLAIAEWILSQINALPEQQPQDNPGEGEQGEPGESGESGEQGAEGSEGADQGTKGSESTEGDEGDGIDGEGSGEGGKSPGAARRPDPDCKPAEVEPSLKIKKNQMGVRVDHNVQHPPGSNLFGGSTREVQINVPARLRYEVRRLFDNSGLTMFTPGRRSGSLNVRSLHRSDDRLFQRRDDVEGIDSAVSIVFDCSGSMSGRMEQTCNTAYALADSLINAEVKVQLICFSGFVSIEHDWTSNRATFRNVLSKICAGGGTNDRAAVRIAMDSLLIRPERRRVMFVLTDGQGAVQDVRSLCESAKALGITVIGIGIKCDVSASYPQSVTVMDIKKLGEVVFNQIKLAA